MALRKVKNLSRRQALSTATKIGIALGLGTIIGATCGYFGGILTSPPTAKTVTETVTKKATTISVTRTTTITSPKTTTITSPITLIKTFTTMLSENTGMPTLRQLAEEAGILIGFASVNNFWSLPDSEKYIEVAKREFNILTPENQMKWDSIRPGPDSYNFDDADKHVKFALDNDMVVHGHTLVWHNQLPTWLTAGEWKKEELKNLLEEHIKTVVKHYKGRVMIWDVVNEALDDDGTFRQSIWYNAMGSEYIEKAFLWAREADPDAILIYNDYGIETINSKSDALYNLVRKFKEKGIPIDGIGLQMHITVNGIDYESFAKNLERFATLDLKLYITEMDVRIQGKPTVENLLKQAEVYKSVLQRCLNQPAVKAIQFWGFTDKYSWIPYFFPDSGSALIFDENYNPKPAYYALKEVLSAYVVG